MRVLLSLGDRSRDKSSDSDTNSEDSDTFEAAVSLTDETSDRNNKDHLGVSLQVQEAFAIAEAEADSAIPPVLACSTVERAPGKEKDVSRRENSRSKNTNRDSEGNRSADSIGLSIGQDLRSDSTQPPEAYSNTPQRSHTYLGRQPFLDAASAVDDKTLLYPIPNCADTEIDHSQSCQHRCNTSTAVKKSTNRKDSLIKLSEALKHVASKRLRNDIGPEATNATPTFRRKMTVGGRFKSDSDDESSFVVHPQQNPPRRYWIEPFAIQNNPAIATSDTIDENHDSPQFSVASDDLVEVAASKPSEAIEEYALAQFLTCIKKRGFELIEQEGDGNCLFRAVSLQVYGSADSHSEVRERCMDYMAQNEEHFSNFIAATSDDELKIPQASESMSAFQAYVTRKRMKGVHGNHTEIQALSELFNRPVEVYTPGNNSEQNTKLQPMNIFHEEYKTADHPIRLSYHDGNHYNAIIDPLIPTAGLGLGLPGLKVGQRL
jgi:OTU-like cysteine protease